MKKVWFIESDFDLKLPGAVIIKPLFLFIRSFQQRILVNIVYFFRLLFIPYRAIIVAPWGLFWIPALLNICKIKKFTIISLTCDTFLGRKTIIGKKDGLIGRAKYFLAKLTYKEPKFFIYCSEVVKGELQYFGVPQEKLVYKYQEWCRDDARAKRFQKFLPDLSQNHFLFIGHYYNMFQKRLDILIDAYIEVFQSKKYDDMKLIVVGGGWETFFGSEKIEEYKKYNIELKGYTYEIDSYIQDATFYVHPGEYEGFGVSVLEAMHGGIIPLVSALTGATEAVKELSTELICPLNQQAFEGKILYLLALTFEQRKVLSSDARVIAKSFNQDTSIEALQYNLKKIVESI